MSLCDPMDCSLPGSSVYGILQAKILAWVAMPSSRASSQPRDRTKVCRVAGGFFFFFEFHIVEFIVFKKKKTQDRINTTSHFSSLRTSFLNIFGSRLLTSGYES